MGKPYHLKVLSDVYIQVCHWKKNCFNVPFGQYEKLLVSELARLFKAYGEGSSLESVALKASAMAPVLLLMKPHEKSSTKEHVTCLKRRFELWKKGDFEELLIEGRTIQRRLKKPHTFDSNPDKLSRYFLSLMSQGKTNSAVSQLFDSEKAGVLDLNTTVHPIDPNSKTVSDVLKEKHPPPHPCDPKAVLPFSSESTPPFHSIIYDSINANQIRSAAVKTSGAGSPSELDAHCWRRLCTSFKSASDELCHALAFVARRICCEYVDPKALALC